MFSSIAAASSSEEAQEEEKEEKERDDDVRKISLAGLEPVGPVIYLYTHETCCGVNTNSWLVPLEYYDL